MVQPCSFHPHGRLLSVVGGIVDSTGPEIVLCYSIMIAIVFSEDYLASIYLTRRAGAEGPWRPELSSLDILCKTPFLPRVNSLISRHT